MLAVLESAPVDAVGVLLGGGLIAALVQLYKAKTDKGATIITSTSEAAESIANAAGALIGPLKEELVTTRERMSALEGEMTMFKESAYKQIAGLKDEVAKLTEVIKEQTAQLATLTVANGV